MLKLKTEDMMISHLTGAVHHITNVVVYVDTTHADTAVNRVLSWSTHPPLKKATRKIRYTGENINR